MTLHAFKCPFCGYRFRADPRDLHAMLKIAGLFLVLGALALFAAMGAYLAG